MATARPMSPGGALLRSSRMFSLPPPIPSQVNNMANSSVNRSETATMPYPTLQSVTTPAAARSRGDWGFKRPFPLKSTTKSSTPLIRVKQVDTIEHVTDFSSAADHTLSLEKFQEMHIPIVMPVPSEMGSAGLSVPSKTPRKSVFEETHDMIDIDPADKAKLRGNRWKFDGPWLAGMAEGEFQKYVRDKVRPRRSEFRQWLRAVVAEEMNEKAVADALDKGEGEITPLTAADITDEQLNNKLRHLREDRISLYNLVGRFLDLAPINPRKDLIPYQTGEHVRHLSRAVDVNPYAETGPPTTHPSAGISYLRSNAFIENHPLYGPQAAHRHVMSRVLLHKSNAGGPSKAIGVGGFVANTPPGDFRMNQRSSDNGFNPNISGGKKMYVEPIAATVDPKGNVKIAVGAPNPEAEYVARELDGESSGSQDLESLLNRKPTTAPMKPRNFGTHIISSPASYGLGKPPFTRAAPKE